tara:strand:- start:298 stop:438 length:141 start_codon:yes stop_codon:yes gene_type:complete
MILNSEELSELIKFVQEQHNLSTSEKETEFWCNLYLKLRNEKNNTE